MKKLIYTKGKQLIEIKLGNEKRFSFTYKHGQPSETTNEETTYIDGKLCHLIAIGCATEIMLNYPELSKYVNLHLADSTTGEPMYSIDNGYYWIKEGKPQNTINLLRLNEKQAQELRNEINLTKMEFIQKYIITNLERWRQEAEELNNFINN